MELINVGKEKINDEIQNVVSSRQIADKFEKLHKNVLQAVRNLEISNDFSRLNFKPSKYIDKNGDSKPMLLMTRDGFSLLAMGFTGKEATTWKVKFIEAFNAMEKALIKNKPQTAIEWAQAFIESETKRVELEKQIEQEKPKVEFHDAINKVEQSGQSINDVAKELGTGRNKLFSLLRNGKILMHNNIPYQQYVDRGYFLVIPIPITMGEKEVVTNKTLVTGKGLVWLRKKFPIL